VSGRPADVVVAFVADEEAGGVKGARFLVDNHPEEFEGCTEAVSEVGGFSVTLPNDVRMYPIQSAEKGMAWLRLVARGRPGHGSMRHEDNAVTRLAEAVTRIGRYEFPVVMTKTVRQFLEALAEQLGVDIDVDAADRDEIEALIGRLGGLARMVGATLSNTANPTMLEAGYKSNVIPSSGSAVVDGPVPARPGGGVRAAAGRPWSARASSGVGAPGPGGGDRLRRPLVEAMAAGAAGGGQRGAAGAVHDVRRYGRQVVRAAGHALFGFSPLLLPADLDFAAMFHGIDERVPTDALRFGVRVLQRFVAAS
jgi:acetylornithine deacetylase/succinyl-diaminopimelate desuccinylase-like protein